jgi:hypothetical protein
LERTVVVLIVDEEDADELLADIDFGRVIFLGPRHDADLGIAEDAFEICVKFPDFLNVHGRSPIGSMIWDGVLGRDGGNRQSLFDSGAI